MKQGNGTPQHIVYWSPTDWLTSRVRNRSIVTGDVGLRVVYFELLGRLYTEGGDLPADPALLGDLLGLPEEMVADALPKLERLGSVVKKDGCLTNPRVTRELERYRALTEKRRKAARSRWEDASAEHMHASAEHVHSKETMAKAKAKASGSEIEEVFKYWVERTEKDESRTVLTPKRKSKIAARLAEEPDGAAGLKRAVDGAVRDPWYAGKNDDGKVYWGFENIFCNRDRIEKLQASAARFGPKASSSPSSRPRLPAQDSGAKDLFERVKEEVQVPAHLKRTWLVPMEGWTFEGDGVLVVRVPSEQHKERLRGYYREPIKAALEKQRPGMKVKVVVSEVE